jgi:MFS family permease
METPAVSGPYGIMAPDDDATELPSVDPRYDPAEDEPADGGSSNALAVLKNRNFLLLWLSQAATQIGGNMVVYGLTVLIFDKTNSTSAVALLLLTFLAPAVFFSAIAGVYVDRLDRRIILIVTNLLRAIFFALIYLASGNLLAIFVLNIAISSATTFFAPAEAAMIPVLVERRQLLAANGLFTFTQNAAFALGFVMFGPLVANLAGAETLILTVAALYLVATVFTIILPSVPGTKSGLAARDAVEGTEQAVAAVISELREGFAYIRAHRNVSWSLVYLGVTASLIGVLGVLGQAFARDALGLAPKDWVIVVLPLAMGIMTGILLLNNYGKYFPRRRLMEGGLVGLGVLLVALSAAGPITRFLQGAEKLGPVNLSGMVSLLAVVVGIAFLAGIAYALVAIPAQVGLQEELPEEVRGRVFGVLNMLVSVASFLPIIIVGTISDQVGTTVVLVVVGLSVTGIGVVSVMSHRPHPAAPADTGA